MKYPHNKTKSAELLRLALPLMSRHDAALHPISYAIWYDYVAGADQALKARIDELTRDDGRLSEDAIRALYRDHVAEIDDDAARRIGDGIQRVIGQISASALQAGDHAVQYGATLEGLVNDVAGGSTPSIAGEALDAVLRGTRQMQGAMVDLKGRLDQSQAEIEVLRQEISRAREEALADALTGLANRRAFDIAIDRCTESPSGAVGPCLVFADIDHFKRINDTYGHLFGDKVIRAVAEVLKAASGRGNATVARYGGEEFAIVLPDMPLDGARELAEQIRATIERSRIRRADCGSTLESVTISLGVAVRRGGESSRDLIRRADGALYASKKDGRNRVTVAAEA